MDEVSRIARERTELVKLCVDLYERLASDGLRAKLRHGLERSGIRILTAEGERFNPLDHRANGEELTAESQLDGIVASTQQAGYADHGRRVKEPTVIVYKFHPRSEESHDRA